MATNTGSLLNLVKLYHLSAPFRFRTTKKGVQARVLSFSRTSKASYTLHCHFRPYYVLGKLVCSSRMIKFLVRVQLNLPFLITVLQAERCSACPVFSKLRISLSLLQTCKNEIHLFLKEDFGQAAYGPTSRI